MSQYAAFDVSLKDAHGCVVDQEGRITAEGRVAAEPEAMAAWLERRAPGLVRVGVETGPLATWHVHALRRLQVPVVCLDARYAHAVLACRPHKTDKNDARGLAELVRLGAYREVAIKECGERAPARAADGARPAGGDAARPREPAPRAAEELRPAGWRGAWPGVSGAGPGAGRR
jgi:transposase